MKRLFSLLCIFALLILSTGIVSADTLMSDQFAITGYTTSYDYRVLSNGHTVFDLTAVGYADGRLEGTFSYREWGYVDFNPETGQGSGEGINYGIMTITADNGSRAFIQFGGQFDLTSVQGHWSMLGGTGIYANLKGEGTYIGDAGFEFTVVFSGAFHR